jgi:CDP-paratose 2-epimerase
MRVEASAFCLDEGQPWPAAVSLAGVKEGFSTEAPVSLYGATKLASELLAQEYAGAFGIPVWINRCGVLAGAGQFGTSEQGVFSYWLCAHSTRRPLKYLGFGGQGFQVRDALHPRDLARIVDFQLRSGEPGQLLNVSGGQENSMSLRQLTDWCDQRFGLHQPIADDSERPYDIPWLVLDSSKALAATAWKPQISLIQILEEISEHAVRHPEWLTWCGV